MIPTPLELMGAPGSPYTRKMLALLRYRRIPYRLAIQGSPEVANRPQAKVALLPTFFLPGEDGTIEAVTDSTPLIRRFEGAFPERPVVPPDPGMAVVDEVPEDFGDEWLTKAMFHYRWTYEADIEKASSVLPLWRDVRLSEDGHLAFKAGIAERQIERLRVVGSNPTTLPVIEASYRRILGLLDAHFRGQGFLMGDRPGSSDFAFHGQLTALAGFDPTPAAITLAASPRVYAWVGRNEDLSGMEPSEADWISSDAVPESLLELLGEVGRVYAPFLLANSAALASGAPEVTTTIDGAPWVQTPFPYQGKCLAWLRNSYAALEPPAREGVDRILAGTGCAVLFAS